MRPTFTRLTFLIKGSEDNTYTGKKNPEKAPAKARSSYEDSSDENTGYAQNKKRKSSLLKNKEYSSFLTRLEIANPNFKWKKTAIGLASPHYMNALNFSKKLVLITDPYNPKARRTGI